jgi:hypothetical protein
MNRIALVVGLWLMLAAPGCSAFDFEVNQSTDEVVLTGNLELFRAGQPVPANIIPTTQFTFALDQEPAGIYLDDAILRLTDTVPSGKKMTIPFSFIRQLDLEIAPTTVGSTLPVIRLATLVWPQAGAAIHFSVDDGTNLLPYVREGFELRSTLDGKVPAADLSFRVDLTIGIQVF